ncbi:methyltransferase domain-containing protein [Neorhodopirellula pilleata]|uniref:23S rRNA (Guanine(745)-N(1))-methyltransferase n=1 Tax=Neorhodopirellula pilleata TaxID=2714738 RepID=A0A5C6AUY1_9BACT|nr:methyltransferase domain-containing protein [Neorhodopirellula pilleata]TWU01924.1 23S rRNA (guanine(745)-N(1))-methyltransferase [Neorhodopirellula pilleata]
MMFELRCTVRDCQHILQRNESGATCEAGHHFDRAKQGYWNLLQPQDRKSKHPGDCDEAVLARHRWLRRGYADGLIETLRHWTNDGEPDQRTLDLGCGEGSFGPALFSNSPQSYCGIDLSKRAIRLAVQNWREATWVLANADRVLPVADASVDRIVSLFGRRPVTEIRRALKPGGDLIVAVPGEEDLIELRERVQQSGHRRSRAEAIVDEMYDVGLECVEQINWAVAVNLQTDAIADAMAMTYRGVRHSQQSRLESIDAMKVTLAADLMLFRG